MLFTEKLQYKAKAIAEMTTIDYVHVLKFLEDLKKIAEDVMPLTERACASYGSIIKALQNDCPSFILEVLIKHGTGPSVQLTRTIIEGLDQRTSQSTITDDEKIGLSLDQFSFIVKEMNDDVSKSCALRIRSRNHVDRVNEEYILQLARSLGKSCLFSL